MIRLSVLVSIYRPSVILGVTNPFFAKTLQHWPHIIRIGDMKQAGRWLHYKSRSFKLWCLSFVYKRQMLKQWTTKTTSCPGRTSEMYTVCRNCTRTVFTGVVSDPPLQRREIWLLQYKIRFWILPTALQSTSLCWTEKYNISLNCLSNVCSFHLSVPLRRDGQADESQETEKPQNSGL